MLNKTLIQMDKEISSSIKAKLDLQDEIAYVNGTINSKSETLAQIINAVGTDLDAEKQRSQEKDMVLMNQESSSMKWPILQRSLTLPKVATCIVLDCADVCTRGCMILWSCSLLPPIRDSHNLVSLFYSYTIVR